MHKMKCKVEDIIDSVENVFCSTGKGGGIDATCGRGNGVAKGVAKGSRGKDATSSPKGRPEGAEVGAGKKGFSKAVKEGTAVDGGKPSDARSVLTKHAGEIIAKEKSTAPPPGKAYDPVPDEKHARVGVPADQVPPKPPIGRLPNLTKRERAAETAFKEAYEKDPDGMADEFLAGVVNNSKKSGEPPTFGTDDAKMLSKDWHDKDMSPEQRMMNHQTLNLSLHQTANAVAKRAFVKHLDSLKEGDAIMVTNGGCGCHVIDTMLMMHDGSLKAVQDIEVGEFLMGPDSQPREVLRLIRGKGKLHSIIPNKGKSFVVNEDHILAIQAKQEKGRRGKITKVNLSVKEFLAKGKSYRKDSFLYRTAVEFPYTPVALDPYFLGIWLGNDAHSLPLVTTVEPEVVDYMDSFTQEFDNVELVVNEKGSFNGVDPNKPMGYKIALLDKCPGKGEVDPVTALLREIGVLKNKHIPQSYKINSRDVRLRLLAGLLDTDGSVDGAGMEFSTKSESLAYDVAYIARSLGYASYVSSRWIQTKVLDAEKQYWRVSIDGDLKDIPFKVARKIPRERVINKNPLRTGFNVEDAGTGDYYGFNLSGDHLYLMDDFTVTHNSGKGYGLGKDKDGKPFVPDAYEKKTKAAAIWDSAGDQNSTENSWILKEAEKRGLKVDFTYTHTDPYTQWDMPGRGVVHRANDVKDGRMVDARVFADSYAHGAKNFDKFHAEHKDNPNVSFTFIANGNPPAKLPKVPPAALKIDADHLYDHAVQKINDNPEVARGVRRGALLSKRIWPKQ